MQLDERGLYGNYSLWHIPFWQTTWFKISIVSVFSLIGLFAIIFIIKKLRKKKKTEIAAWDYLLQKLMPYKETEFETKESAKAFYATVTYEFKQYLFKRYGYDVRYKTDEEVIFYLERHEFNEELLTQLTDIMHGGVYVKFANMHAMQEQIKKHLESSISLVKKTIPKEQNI